MASGPKSAKPGFRLSTRVGLSLAQGTLRLFGSGAVVFEAHNLFLKYYDVEWRGIQAVGVNDCARQENIANGDLFEGTTICHQPENFFPWFEVYRHHPVTAAAYYCVAAVIIIAVGLVWRAVQQRLVTSTPFGDAPQPADPSDSEHLR